MTTITNAIMMEKAIAALRAVDEDPAVIEKAEKHLATLTKKSNGVTKTRKENEETARKVYDIMPDEPITPKWVMDHTNIMTSQKAVAVLNVAVDLKLVKRIPPVKSSQSATYQKI